MSINTVKKLVLPHRRELLAKRNLKIAMEYMNGVKIREIAKSYGISERRVKQILNDFRTHQGVIEHGSK